MRDKIFTPRKSEVYNMYPDEPKSSLRKRMIAIIKETNDNINKHGLTPRQWKILKEEMGNPTHNRYGEPL